MGKSCQLSEVERDKLQQWTAAHGTPQQALHCRIVLAAAAGESDVTIAHRLSVNRNTVILWRKRFGDEGLDGLWDIASGRGRKPTFQIDKIAAIVEATLQTKPAGMTHWSCRTMAQSQGVSKSTVHNIWRAHNLQPHRTKTFKLSRDPKYLEKMTDVVGLYLNPPQQDNHPLRGRKEPDAGFGWYTAGVTDQKGALWYDDPRLQAQRHDYLVRRPGHFTG